MTLSLPDVNLLVALAWPSHVHHRQARRWFEAKARAGWATCPFTQCGFVRLSSNPKVVPYAVRPQEAIDLLQRIMAIGGHVFWPDDVNLAEELSIPTHLLIGHRQVADAYLLAMALRHNGTLVTLDRSVIDLLPVAAQQRSCVELLPLE